ncbi:MAG TPA: PIN domain-containing protein [Thermoanaerobaculia bacterium]|nr:PIN domain-containing protein [Thermoanaerobaculia bacterium]
MGLLKEIGGGPVGLDTSIFIYLIEENPRYLPLIEPAFLALDDGDLRGATSSLTLLETIVMPLRRGNRTVVERYEVLLTHGSGLRLVDIDRRVLQAAAHLRAVTSIKTPDALQLASSMLAGCPVFLTNDDRIPAVPGLRVLCLDDFLEGAPS